MCDIVTKLDETIVSLLDEEQRGFYEREFEFFDAINSCSEFVNPKLKKEEKAREVRENLHVIMERWRIDKGGLYLPSSPGSEVFEIFPDDSIPLMSRKKCLLFLGF